MNPCDGCTHYKPGLVYAMACYRSKRMKDGRVLKAPDGVGFPAEYERGHADLYEGRSDGDHCGEDGNHWRAS